MWWRRFCVGNLKEIRRFAGDFFLSSDTLPEILRGFRLLRRDKSRRTPSKTGDCRIFPRFPVMPDALFRECLQTLRRLRPASVYKAEALRFRPSFSAGLYVCRF